MMEFLQLIRERRSVKSYDPEKTISDEELRDLFEEVTLSPSSFNLQHWMFIAVRDPKLKKKLREAAWDQQMVEDSSVAFLICGKLDAYKDAPVLFADAPKEVRGKVLPMIEKFYAGKEQLQRDEAIRSASLAAMTLMYAAKSRGWSSCPIIGFDPESVSKQLKLSPNTIPVMMMVLGHQKEEPKPRSYRRPVEEVVRMNSFQGPGLSV